MNLWPRQQLAVITALAVLSLSIVPQRAVAQDNVVPLSDLRQDVRSAAEARTRNVQDINRVLQLPAAQDALRKANVEGTQIAKALSTLSDEELSRLADRARAAEKDVEGGVIVTLLAIIGLIVVIIIVVAAVT